MLRIAITGGIASGKSFAIEALRRRGFPVLSSDAEVAKIYEKPEVLREIAQAFGLAEVSKPIIREYIYKNPKDIRKLEAIIYKHLFKRYDEFERENRRKGAKFCFFEVPLLFERGLERRFDRSILITAPHFVAKRRFLSRGTGLTMRDFTKFKAMQMHEKKKHHRADSVIKNTLHSTKPRGLFFL